MVYLYWVLNHGFKFQDLKMSCYYVFIFVLRERDRDRDRERDTHRERLYKNCIVNMKIKN